VGAGGKQQLGHINIPPITGQPQRGDSHIRRVSGVHIGLGSHEPLDIAIPIHRACVMEGRQRRGVQRSAHCSIVTEFPSMLHHRQTEPRALFNPYDKAPLLKGNPDSK